MHIRPHARGQWPGTRSCCSCMTQRPHSKGHRFTSNAIRDNTLTTSIPPDASNVSAKAHNVDDLDATRRIYAGWIRFKSLSGFACE
jgi:hypothetical protein